ncbi:unnamed protein product [Adineta steineri]|uniref:Uncharacterized protein n=2 Tax=Adineta steineri TaxID=433720 RepID=A0A815M031_9BILA|nr:unnamed protein product [Adineta steineri]
MRQSSTNRKETRSTKQIRKRARSFIDDEAQEDDQLHTQSGSSSESIRSYIEDNVICNSVNVHDKNSENITKMQISNENDTSIQDTHQNNEETSIIIIENNTLVQQNKQIELTSTTCDAISNTPNNSLASPVQTSIDRYFPTIGNSFESIENLNEYSSNFLIRGKVIYISSIRYFGTNNKVFDGIICDLTSEIKVVGFNEQVDRLYNHMKITIENGQVQKTNENFRTPYSMFEIRLTNNTNIQSYISSGFAPNIKITKTDIRNISELLNGMNVDVEGQIIFDNNVSTTVGGNNGMQLRRRSLKIKDQTGTVPLMHLITVVLSGISHWCSRTLLNIDVDWDIPLIFFGVIVGYPGSNKSTAITLIERATRDVEQYLQIKIENSHVNGSATIESLLHELEKKTSIIQAFDEFNTFQSSFSLYRADKAAYYRSILNTLWNGPKYYFRQLVKGDIKCENPWLSIVAAAHPGAIINILKEESNQLGNDGLFARFVFSARISPEDIHKRSKREIDTTTGEYTIKSSNYPSLAHIMYFIHLMHHNKSFTLKISQEANEILMRAHNEYSHMVVGFQGYQDELCTLFSKSRDHLYRICGLLHLLHQACIYILKAEPRLEYLVFDDASAESIEKMAMLAQQNIDEYLTISPDIAETTLELMNFYVNTKKLLYGFPLITVPPLLEINVGPSISQQNNTTEENIQINNSPINVNNNDNASIFSNHSRFSDLSSSICPFNGSVVDASIKKILFYPYRIISSFRLAQILRRPGVNSENIKKIFTFMANCKMGTFSIKKQKKRGKPRVLFTKDDIPEDKESEKHKMMIDFINGFNITSEEYGKYMKSTSETSIVSTNNITTVSNQE